MTSSADFFKNSYGFGFKNKKFVCFFGNASADISHLQNEFTDFKFCRLKQTHSNTVVESIPSIDSDIHLFGEKFSAEGDAHFTHLSNRALTIATADCMPIMIWCKQTDRAAAVHAGWRGVENKIIIKALEKLIETGSSKKSFEIFVGPSIQKNSFEVDRDVFEKISASALGLPTEKFADFKNEKYYIDLNRVLLRQIFFITSEKFTPDFRNDEEFRSENVSVVFSKIDTKTSFDFFSYRRGKQSKERNLSFACSLIE